MLVHLMLFQRSVKLSSILFILFFFCSYSVISSTLSSSFLICSSVSFYLQLFPFSVFFISVIVFLISVWLSFKITFFISIFIYFWLHWVFVAVHGLSLVAASRGYSLLQCAGFSLWWLLLLPSTGSRHAGFSSCSTQAQ